MLKTIKNILIVMTIGFIMHACKQDPNVTMNNTTDINQEFRKALDTAQIRYKALLTEISNTDKVPRSIGREGTLNMVDYEDWTSGFFPGTLWYLYEYTNNSFWKTVAEKYTRILEPGKTRTNTHDLGFIYYCSYGNAYRLTGDSYYKNVIFEASNSLIERYNPNIGCIRSWDWGEWSFPVIIDNMMNLEMLYWASKELKDSVYLNIANSHANNTLKNHFRKDYSSCHVVDYCKSSGEVLGQYTHQGAFVESIWTRGQAWGLYGFTMSYRETLDTNYLNHATSIANFVISKLPDDYIPFWDCLAPNIPDEPRDASAAAIFASALIELADYVPEKKDEFRSVAEEILLKLCSSKYLNTDKRKHNFILNHSTGDYPQNNEINSPISYADYYFIEALLRYMNIENGI